MPVQQVTCCGTCGCPVPDGTQYLHNNHHVALRTMGERIIQLENTAVDLATRILELEQELEKKQNPTFVINREDDGSLRIRPAEEPHAEDPF